MVITSGGANLIILPCVGLAKSPLSFNFKQIFHAVLLFGESFTSMAFKRPFRIGDLIEIDGFKGKVTNMSLRETLIKTLDGKEVFIPNGLIAKNGLVNYTLDDLLRTEFVIGLDYNDNTEEALQVIESILQNEEGVLKNPEPFAVIDELATSTVNVRVSYWYMTNDQHPGGKFINYHSGPAPEILQSIPGVYPTIDDSDADPLHVLTRHFTKQQLIEYSDEMLSSLKAELA